MSTFADIECPVCGALPRQRCTAEDGTPVLGGAHAARVREAQGKGA